MAPLRTFLNLVDFIVCLMDEPLDPHSSPDKSGLRVWKSGNYRSQEMQREERRRWHHGPVLTSTFSGRDGSPHRCSLTNQTQSSHLIPEQLRAAITKPRCLFLLIPDGAARLKTLLGSCKSSNLWNSARNDPDGSMFFFKGCRLEDGLNREVPAEHQVPYEAGPGQTAGSPVPRLLLPAAGLTAVHRSSKQVRRFTHNPPTSHFCVFIFLLSTDISTLSWCSGRFWLEWSPSIAR